jgi:hypothetical protein
MKPTILNQKGKTRRLPIAQGIAQEIAKGVGQAIDQRRRELHKK